LGGAAVVVFAAGAPLPAVVPAVAVEEPEPPEDPPQPAVAPRQIKSATPAAAVRQRLCRKMEDMLEHDVVARLTGS
jgi:hypothetical protein